MVIKHNTKLQWRIVQLKTDFRSISCSLLSSNRGGHQRYIPQKSWMFKILKISNTPKPITATIKILFTPFSRILHWKLTELPLQTFNSKFPTGIPPVWVMILLQTITGNTISEYKHHLKGNSAQNLLMFIALFYLRIFIYLKSFLV